MTEFIKICAAIGMFTTYVFITGLPGCITYHFLKDTNIDKPVDLSAGAKSILVAYAVGLIIFIWAAIYFILVRG